MPASASVASRTGQSHVHEAPAYRVSPAIATRWFIAIVVAAAIWRIALAAQLPVMSRDGVVFCQYANALREQGLGWLRHPDAQQHPLFPALLLGGRQAARTLGAPDDPLTWQVVGQALSCAAGVCVVLLVGAIAARLVTLLELPIDERLAQLAAMALTALLDLNLCLSADVMSDQLHLALYLAAVLFALPSWSPWRLGLAGLFAGLAFLTRQEGFVPVLAALIALGLAWKSLGTRRASTGMAAVLCGFLVAAVPYWAIVGRFSTKKDPAKWFEQDATLLAPKARQHHACGLDKVREPVAAKLETIDVSWYAALPHVLYRVLRAGRVVIPLLALLPLLNLRSRWLDPRLTVVSACIGGHLALVTLLLDRYGYLATRHVLVVAALLTPFAAMLVARLAEIAVVRRSVALGVAAAAIAFGPLLAYAFRVPNGHEGYLRAAAQWLGANAGGDETLVSGSSGRRIAFYADAPWRPWAETPDDVAGVLALFREVRSGHFAIETGRGFERQGNDTLLAALLGASVDGLAISEAWRIAIGSEGTLHVLRFGPRE